MELIIISVAAYMIIGMVYFSLTCEDEKKVVNPLYWVQAMFGWLILMWSNK